MNGSAHIMNDEATRKYLQAVKRLLTFLQRAYPTDPSRSVDFDGFRDAGLGAKGAGSDKAVSTPGLHAIHQVCMLRCLMHYTQECQHVGHAAFSEGCHVQTGLLAVMDLLLQMQPASQNDARGLHRDCAACPLAHGIALLHAQQYLHQSTSHIVSASGLSSAICKGACSAL